MKINDVAKDNIVHYETVLNNAPQDVKDVACQLKQKIRLGFNTGLDKAILILKGRNKSRFEIVAERRGMSVSELAALPHAEQVDLISDGSTSEYPTIHERRVTFSGHFDDGHILTYYSLLASDFAGNPTYGAFYFVINHDSILATALKYDSLKKYFTDSNEFLYNECIKDLLPYTYIDCLIASKYLLGVSAISLEGIINIISNEVASNDMPLEVMTTDKVDASNVVSALIPQAWYSYFIGLSERYIMGETLLGEEGRNLKNFNELTKILINHKIPLKVVDSW